MEQTIELLILDVDGVLTDGSIVIDDSGRETKFFNVQDGLGIRLAQLAGLRVYIVSSRTSAAVEHRARELRIDGLYQQVKDKLRICREIAAQNSATLDNVAYVGDDLVDMGVMKSVGCPIAVANGIESVKKISCHITQRKGGHGAVREAVEWILKEENKLDGTIAAYLQEHGID